MTLLYENLANTMKSKRCTLAVAESCTGGMIGASITTIPGSSEFFKGSAVTYSNHSKEKILKVSDNVLKKYGAVSEEVVKKMAENVRILYDSDISIAVTGIAGPDGGTPEKPVGLVYIALSHKDNVIVTKNIFNGDRENIRKLTVECSINMLIDFMKEEL